MQGRIGAIAFSASEISGLLQAVDTQIANLTLFQVLHLLA
jgi:hypothetical protein